MILRFRITETNRSRSEFGLWLLSFLWTGVSLWRTRPRPLSLLCLRLLPFSLLSEVKQPFLRGGCEASASGVADGEKSSDAAEHRGGGGGGGGSGWSPPVAHRRPLLPFMFVSTWNPPSPSSSPITHTPHQAQLLHQAGGGGEAGGRREGVEGGGFQVEGDG